jgi:glucosyl-3-phosphoglycerate synthase
MRRSFHHGDFPAPLVLAAKRGRTVSLCLPARDEATTVGRTVAAVREALVEALPIVDEILVIDDGSSDNTADVAAAAGARVVASVDVLPGYDDRNGKGQAMWKAVHAARGDVVVFCDADVEDFDPAFVLGLVGPLLTHDDVSLVKGFYDRPLMGRSGEGGRVTELMARPLIAVLHPHLADVAQPLSGECAAPRRVLESVPFVGGYGVDLGLLLDVTALYGNDSLVQTDLGVRIHRNRTLGELGPQALAVLQVGMARAGLSPCGAGGRWETELAPAGGEPRLVVFEEMPALTDIPAYRESDYRGLEGRRTEGAAESTSRANSAKHPMVSDQARSRPA